MIKPIVLDDLFIINDGLTPQFEEGVVIIDNFYKNYDQIYEMLSSSYMPRWKWCEGSRNFIDYHDCRLEIDNNFYGDSYITKINSLIELIKYFYNDQRDIGINDTGYNFNVYQNIKRNVSNSFQHFPHIDLSYNAIVYLDKVSSGGTAIYPEIENVPDSEEQNILFDISDHKKIIIESKPNRMVVFNGTRYHGGYIENHDAYTGENWRINQVMFFDELNNTP